MSIFDSIEKSDEAQTTEQTDEDQVTEINPDADEQVNVNLDVADAVDIENDGDDRVGATDNIDTVDDETGNDNVNLNQAKAEMKDDLADLDPIAKAKELMKQMNESFKERLTDIDPSKITTKEIQIETQDFVGDLFTEEDETLSIDKLNIFANKVYERAIQSAVDYVNAGLPTQMHNTLQQQLGLQRLMDQFYNDNPHLQGSEHLVQADLQHSLSKKGLNFDEALKAVAEKYSFLGDKKHTKVDKQKRKAAVKALPKTGPAVRKQTKTNEPKNDIVDLFERLRIA